MIKKSMVLLLLLWGQQYCFAQFSSARLQATGLTCALCSRAIHQALEKLPFVEKVTADIKQSAFDIQLRQNEAFDPGQIRISVEEAGFFVGALWLIGNLDSPGLTTGTPVRLGHCYYQLVGSPVAGLRRYQVLNPSFLSEKENKKLSKTSVGALVKNGQYGSEPLPIFYIQPK